MRREEVDQVIERFTDGVVERVAPVAVWAHGSLGTDDFQPGRSDLDLIVVVEAPLDEDAKRRLTEFHELLDREEPAAEKLHCSYMAANELDDVEVIHFTWAHASVYPRTVTPVTRCELHRFGRVYHGPSPAEVLPEVSDAELAEFVRESLGGYWLEATRHRARWRKDIWVDLGMLTYARGVVTLREGRLITKREAIEELARLGAPARVVEDVRARRYGEQPPGGAFWRARRARQTRTFVRDAIRRTMAQ
jgi:predicted nucleotidyltransferase